MHATARHAVPPEPSPPPPAKSKVPKFLSRFKMEVAAPAPTPPASPPFVESLTDVARDIQYYAEGKRERGIEQGSEYAHFEAESTS